MNQLRLLGVAGALLFSTTALANEVPGFYFGASAGQAAYKGINSGMKDYLESVPTATVTTVSSERRDRAWKVYGGTRVAPSLGFELGFMDLGDSLATGSGTFGGNPATFSGDLKATAFTADAVAYVPVSKEVELFGKAGVYRARVNFKETYDDGSGSVSVSSTDSNVGLKLGLGAQVALSENVGARVEWERLNNVGRDFNESGSKGVDVNVISAGLNVKF